MPDFPGVTHVVVTVTDLEVGLPWYEKLFGVAHGEIVDAPFGSGLAFRDPDNIQLESFAPPAA